MGNQPWPQFQNGIRERSIEQPYQSCFDDVPALTAKGKRETLATCVKSVQSTLSHLQSGMILLTMLAQKVKDNALIE